MNENYIFDKIRLSRRDFLKFMTVTSITTTLYMSLNWTKTIRAAMNEVKNGSINIIWFEAQDCAGDTIALLDATYPELLDVLLGTTHIVGPGMVKLLYHQTVMPQWGENAVDILRKAEKGEFDPYVLVVEGALPEEEHARGIGGENAYFCVVGEEHGKLITCTEWVRRLAKRAIAIVAVGNCASYGGIPANEVKEPPPEYVPASWSKAPTGSIGIFDDPIRKYKGLINRYVEFEPYRNFINGIGVPEPRPDSKVKVAIAVPGCPANGNAILKTLACIILWALDLLPLPELDQYWRPKFIYGSTVHEQCPRAGSYAAGDLRKYPGDNDYRCLFAVGCKGPVSNCPWNKLGWVNGIGGPTRTGGICIACTMPGFTDEYEPFFKPLPAPTPEPFTVMTATIGASAIAGIGIGVAIARKVKKERE